MPQHVLLTGRRSHPHELPALYPSLLERTGGVHPITGRDGDSFSVTDRTSDVLFTPNENAYSYEVKCLEEVIAARKADPQQYTAADNPYRIEYAVYNLRNKRVFDKLKEAFEAGCHVQVLIEADQISDDRPHNKVDEWFEAAGMKVIRSDKNVPQDERDKAHLIGIDEAALMHMKSRILQWKDASGQMQYKLLTGPLNPGGDPVKNDEHLNVFTDPSIVQRFSRRLAEVRRHEPAVNEWQDGAPINILFTPHTADSVTPTKKLFEWIDQENEMILMPIFCLRNLTTRGEQDDLIAKLRKAQDRGARVLIMTDMRKSDGQTLTFDDAGNPTGREAIEMYGRPAHDDQTDERLEAAGLEVIEVVNNRSKFSAMHERFTVFGLTNMKVLSSEGNYTKAAMGSRNSGPKNQESYVFIDSGNYDDNYTGRAYLGRALQLLRKYDNQYDASAEAIIADLQKIPGWPKLKLDVHALVKPDGNERLDLLLGENGDQRIPLPSPDRPGSMRRRRRLIELPFGSILTYRLKNHANDNVSDPQRILIADAPDHPAP